MNYKFIITFTILLLSKAIFSQCVDTLYLGNDTTICAGQSIQLNVSNGYFTYYWNTGSFGKNITVNQTGNYWVKTTKLDTTNLVTNGNFSQGNTGFTTGYVYGTGGSWGLLSSEGQYAISTSPSLTHTNFVSCGDHTTGTGNMMVINASAVLNTSIWCQSFTVTPNTTYIFSAWFTSVEASNPAVLNFNINGNPIGGAVSVSSALCNWQNFYQTWNSGTNTFATICIKNQNTNPSGNDFALDDIYFAKICSFIDTMHVDVLPYPIVNLGVDTTICAGDTIQLDATNTGASFLWHDNTTSQTHTASLAGNYSVQVTNGPCKSVDTIHLTTVQRATPNLGKDTVFCEGTSITLNAGPGVLHSWNNGAFTQSIIPDTSGTYFVKVYSNFAADCPGYDTINLKKIPQPKLGDDTCVWKSSLPYILSAGNDPNLLYSWSSGGTTNSINVNQTGSYSVTVKDINLAPNNGCSDTKDVFVGDENTFILSRLLQADNVTFTELGTGNQSICDHQTLRVIGMQPATGTYYWTLDATPVSSTSYYVFNQYPIGDYTIALDYSNGCVDSIDVKVHSCILTIPNIITPNGDGKNDFFAIKNLTESFPNSTMLIYNRWGKLVFESNNYANDWDGEDCSDGVYYWLLKVADNKDTIENGTITIMRK